MATLAAGTVAVKSTTGFFTAVGIWTALIGGTSAALIAWFRFGPKWKEAREVTSKRYGERIASLEANVKSATDSAHRAELSMTAVVAAVQLLMTEVEKLDPGNTVLKQAREMIAVAVTGDQGMAAAIARLAAVPGAGGRA